MKRQFLVFKSSIAFVMIAFVLSLLPTRSRAQAVDSVPAGPPSTLTLRPQFVPPPLSSRRAEFFKNNPTAWDAFLAQLQRRPNGAQLRTTSRAVPEVTGTWQSTCCTTFYPSNPRLLTDGTVIAIAGSDWYKLTPDKKGSYVNGVWSRIASLPVIHGTQYAPLYFASQLLLDGRLVIQGGEYNNGVSDLSTLGAIYDPVANQWTAIAPPTGWTQIGDAPNVMLGNGTFLLSSCCEDVFALFNAATLSWSTQGSLDFYPNEQGYSLLPNGDVLTIDIWDNYPNGGTTSTWEYLAASGTWVQGPATPVALSDCNWEMGPAVMRPDGTLVAFGAKSGCPSGASTVDPTAIFNSTKGTWISGPVVPAVCGSDGATNCTLNDAPAALLPDGNILFAASAANGPPTHFFEFTTANTIVEVADTVFCASDETAYQVNFLVLPNGEIMATDACDAPEFYTPTGVPAGAWAPVIDTAPSTIAPGGTYSISGTQFSGLSQGAYFGDDVQGSTNYPLVRITNSGTGDVLYARTFNHSTMSIEPGIAGATHFVVPATIELGASTLVVIANGIASAPVAVTVTGAPAASVTLSPTSVSFPSTSIGSTSAAQSITLKNTGTAGVTVSSIALTSGEADDFTESSNCGSMLAAGTSCTISVSFKPGSTGVKTTDVAVTDNASGSPQKVTLSGTATAAAAVTLSPTSVAFPTTTVGSTSAAQSITLKNTGTAGVTVSSIALTSGEADDFTESSNCGSTLAAGANCTISVSFKPGSTGVKTTAVAVTDNASGSPQKVTLSGTATAAAAVTLSPTSVKFPTTTVGSTSAAQSITLKNTGTAGVTVSSIALTSGEADDFTESSNCGSTLAAGASCTISVSFKPGSTGVKTTAVAVTDSASGSPQKVTLNGTATAAAAVTLSPTGIGVAQ